MLEILHTVVNHAAMSWYDGKAAGKLQTRL
jgi:hypothetical protein